MILDLLLIIAGILCYVGGVFALVLFWTLGAFLIGNVV